VLSVSATSGAFTGDLLAADTAATAGPGYNLLVLSSNEGPRFRVRGACLFLVWYGTGFIFWERLRCKATVLCEPQLRMRHLHTPVPIQRRVPLAL
jgi:hypothetical protein